MDYGPTDYKERQEVWKVICNRGRDIKGPWIYLGDLNDILYNYEKE